MSVDKASSEDISSTFVDPLNFRKDEGFPYLSGSILTGLLRGWTAPVGTVLAPARNHPESERLAA